MTSAGVDSGPILDARRWESLVWVRRVRDRIDREFDRPLEADRHPVAEAHPGGLQMTSQAVGPRVQLAIGHLLVQVRGRDRVRGPGRLRLEQLVNALVAREIRVGRVPVDQNFSLLVVR